MQDCINYILLTCCGVGR